MNSTPRGLERMLNPRWYCLLAALGFGAFGVLCLAVGAITLAGSDVFMTGRWFGALPLALGLLCLWKTARAVARLPRA